MDCTCCSAKIHWWLTTLALLVTTLVCGFGQLAGDIADPDALFLPTLLIDDKIDLTASPDKEWGVFQELTGLDFSFFQVPYSGVTE